MRNWPLRWKIVLYSACPGIVVRADEKLTAFVELERAIHEFAVDAIS